MHAKKWLFLFGFGSFRKYAILHTSLKQSVEKRHVVDSNHSLLICTGTRTTFKDLAKINFARSKRRNKVLIVDDVQLKIRINFMGGGLYWE